MRRQYRQRLGRTVLQRLKFLDESGINRAMTRRYGRAPRGQRAVGSVPENRGPNTTVLGILGLSGVSAVATLEGAINGTKFQNYVEQTLGPTLTAGDVVVMDNLPAHKVAGIAEAIQQRGAQLIYLPPYSPDLSPIELCWSKVKTYLGKAKARNQENLETALAQALATVTRSDAQNWFRHCGYALHPS
ncbi:MAG: IS630 family transposase [Dehalococcoidia bacterium]